MRDTSVLPSIFGALLKQMRTESGLSQETLAAECGLDRSYISLLENGKHQPSLASMILIADALGTSAAGMLSQIEGQIPELKE